MNAAISAAAMVPGAVRRYWRRWARRPLAPLPRWPKAGRGTGSWPPRKPRGKPQRRPRRNLPRGKAKSNDGGKDKKTKKKMKCGDFGKYGDLKKKTGEGQFDRDHVPSKAALKQRAKELASQRGENLLPIKPRQSRI